MPELPDVEVFRRYFNATALHQKIGSVSVRSQKILDGISAKQLKATLEGHPFKATRRHGKHLFAEVDSRWLVFHFGMTGFLKYFKQEQKRPEYEQLVIDFVNGYHLSYDCRRKLGRIRLIDDLDTFISEKGLGPDALDDRFDLKAFEGRLNNTRSAIKSALMNQEIMAGIGNIYSDEMLFQAGIYPKMKANQLDQTLIQKLFEVMKEVLKTAITCGANPDELPNTYVIPRRGKDGECPKCGTGLTRITVSGRTGYYCHQCQPEQ
ncbi:MAG: DNA-formamidopyrimidine glycosylase family protein [Deltaproteobacteria bacterium]|nr:DNA-formamidopyrimidine glycosylase family protein [Deltaproteobacteria bacterium]